MREASPAKSDVDSSGVVKAPCAGSLTTAKSGAASQSPTTLHGQFPPRVLVDIRPHVSEMLKVAKGPTLSPNTARFARLDKLHRTIDCTITKIGSAALLRDILQPPNDLRVIEARREAIQELRENKELRAFLDRALAATKDPFFRGMSVEDTALHVLAPELADHSIKKLGFRGLLARGLRVMFNTHYETSVRISAVGKLVRSLEGCPPPTSPLLQEIVGDLQTSLSGPLGKFLDGEAAVTVRSIGTRASIPWKRPVFHLHGKVLHLEEAAVMTLYAMFSCAAQISSAAGELKVVVDAVLQPLVMLAAGMFFMRNFVVTPKTPIKFQEQVAKEPGVLKSVDTIGRLDALLSLAKFEEKLGDRGCTPVLRERVGFEATYRGMKHPVVANEESRCVPNDLSLQQGRVAALTGPNSGGKTTIATALVQNQVLAHLGTKVFAESATLSVADKILYQGPTFKTLGEHGKFGTELKATRKVFMQATERSLVVLDEVGDGTNAEEGIRQMSAVFWGLKQIGSGTVVITHNRELVRQLEKSEIAVAYQMNTTDGKPNFHLEPGLSPHSHANEVAKQLHFSPEEIREIVERRAQRSRRDAELEGSDPPARA